MTTPFYSLDFFTNEKENLAIVVRRMLPYTDAEGVFHPGTGAGIGVWFNKMRFARSGKASAAISAMTATSHALFYTKPEDWEQTLDFKTGLNVKEANNERSSLAKHLRREGYTFVGDEEHKLGESIGVQRPGYSTCKRLTADLTQKERKSRILKMTEYVPAEYKLDDDEIKDLMDRCIKMKIENPIITVSDLFKEICTTVLKKMAN